MSFERIGIRPARILLPAPGIKPETWAWIACDQYTSEPAYWNEVREFVGEDASALRLVFPEADFKTADFDGRIASINASMPKSHRSHPSMTLPQNAPPL